MTGFKIAVTADPDKPRSCPQADLLTELLAAGRLPNFIDAMANPKYAIDGLGNCHNTSVSLIIDLKHAGHVAGWHWATGDTMHFESGRIRKHSWLETDDGWALDCLWERLLFTDRWWYRRFHKARNVTLRDFPATERWLRGQIARRRAALIIPSTPGTLINTKARS